MYVSVLTERQVNIRPEKQHTIHEKTVNHIEQAYIHIGTSQ
jgi:hypothetical protein